MRRQGIVRATSKLRSVVVIWSMNNPFRYFNSSPEIIRLAVMMYVKYPLSLRNVEDLLSERGIDISHETGRRLGLASQSTLRDTDLRSRAPKDDCVATR